MTNDARLLLIDGHSMAFRAFFALPADNFRTSSGQATNAIHGFVSMLLTLIGEENPTHVAVAFDTSAVTFREEEYAEYKGTRDATPEDFKGQITLLSEVLDALNIPWLQQDGIEADDILATLATSAVDEGMSVMVCSGDRDTLQLVNDDVTVLYPVKGVRDLARMTPEAVLTKHGVAPGRYPELAALVGETSDNLPGVPGVGPKTAAKWLDKYDGLDNILSQAASIPGKAGQALRDHIDDVRRNRRLNHLLTDATLPVGPTELTLGAPDRAKVTRVFDTLEFDRLRDRVLTVLADDDSVTETHSTKVTLSNEDLQSWLDHRATAVLGLNVDGRSTPGAGEALALAIADGDGNAVHVDLTDVAGKSEQALRTWLADTKAPKAVHRAKQAWHALQGGGLALEGIHIDTAIATYLCHPDQRRLELEDVTEQYLGEQLTAPESGQGALDIDGQSVNLAARAFATIRLVKPLMDDLDSRGAANLLTTLEMPLQRILEDMEHIGIAVDLDYLDAQRADFDAGVEQAANAAYDSIGRQVNLSSPKQLQEVLFDQLSMPKTKRTKTGYTTDAEALKTLHAQTSPDNPGHVFLTALLTHRDRIRLRQTVEGLMKSVLPDGRVHTTFHQTIAATGRLSSTDPNLQNVPARTADGRAIRKGFVVSAGFETLMTADYSQIEMRIMAHLSDDAGLIEAFISGEDLHAFTASRVFSVPIDEVSIEQRAKIKAMSYGLAYGLSEYGLSRQLDVDIAEARQLRTDYFERFGGVRDYLEAGVEDARRRGFTETLLGRRRYLPDLTSDIRPRREMAERIALNAPIQGSAADIIKVAMINLDAALRDGDMTSRMLLQVHDELVLEVAPGEARDVERIVRDTMGSAANLSVPLDVSVGLGETWLDAAH